MTPDGVFAPLRYRPFRLVWMASFASEIGSFLQIAAASWLMLELTSSSVWVGGLQAAKSLPFLLLALVAGAVADLADRARVMMAAHAVLGGTAALMAALALTNLITPGWLLGLSLVMGAGAAFNGPASQALIPSLVPREELGSAIALKALSFNTARSVGPALGGLIVATSGVTMAFGLNAVSFLGVLLVVLLVVQTSPAPSDETRRVTAAVRDGLRFAFSTPWFRRIIILLVPLAVTTASLQAVLPSRTVELSGDASLYGLLLGAMGVGAILAAVTRLRFMSLLGAAALPLSVALFGVGSIVTGISPVGALPVVGMLAAGAAWVWTMVTLRTVIQLRSPDNVRGRAISLFQLAFQGTTAGGALLAGVLADASNAGIAMVLMGTATIILGMVVPAFQVPS